MNWIIRVLRYLAIAGGAVFASGEVNPKYAIGGAIVSGVVLKVLSNKSGLGAD